MRERRLAQIGRLRKSEDRDFLRPGLCDSLLINANQLENSPEGTAAYLEMTGLPYLVDPMLWRLQVPDWWKNARGDVKRNYARLAARYSAGTSVRMAEGPLVESVRDDMEWRRVTASIVRYQRERLLPEDGQTNLFNPEGVRPSGIVAPALYSPERDVDRINRLLADAASDAAGEPVVVTFVLPHERLLVATEVEHALATVAPDASAYHIWTPGVKEASLVSDPNLLPALLYVIGALANRGVPVVHLHGSYVTAALRDFGIAGVVHHTGWVDKGELAAERRGAIRSCQTYIPGLRHSVRFAEAEALGRQLDQAEYLDHYCGCRFCVGVFGEGQHPLDLLLEDQPVGDTRRRTPTSRATTANTWHYLSARRDEVLAFSSGDILEVVERDLERASALAGDAPALQHLAARLRSA
jgi:hypothetical protein